MGESLETGHNHFYALLWTHGGMTSDETCLLELATFIIVLFSKDNLCFEMMVHP